MEKYEWIKTKVDIRQKIRILPFTSGVYLMKDGRGEVIYAGKAVCLRKRLQSYFRRREMPFSKTDMLAGEIADLDYIETASEAEALLLEAGLIKQYKPKYNVELKDGKSYPFIEITKETFPLISVARPRTRLKGARYYGPYVNAKLIREALMILRKIFPFRTCDPFPKKECLDYHIGLCGAPCIGEIGVKEYAQNIKNVCLILEGKRDILFKNLKTRMEISSRRREFERCARLRDQLRAVGALYSGTRDINYYKEAEQLKRLVNLPCLPMRVEAFDISNIMGHHPVGSMVSFFNGKPDKANYRRFRIKEVDGIDDFRMIAEIVRRRYRRLKDESLGFPDLIVIDGGKGQLSAASCELASLRVEIPILSLAKREEEVFLPNRRNAVILAAHSLALQLLQRVRDEAHRFAISYHRQLRRKNVFET